MDVEKAIEFILEQQAEFWAAMKAADKRMDRFERSLGGIRKLLQYGMKQLARTQAMQRQTAEALRELTESQKITDRKLQAFIDSLQKGGGNGRRRS